MNYELKKIQEELLKKIRAAQPKVETKMHDANAMGSYHEIRKGDRTIGIPIQDFNNAVGFRGLGN